MSAFSQVSPRCARARDPAIWQARGQTQEALTEHLGLTPRYLAGIERGERNLTLDSIEALAAQLGVGAASLLLRTE